MVNNLKVLFVCSSTKGSIAPFIEEQASEIEKQGCSVHYFTIKRKGIKGYLVSCQYSYDG